MSLPSASLWFREGTSDKVYKAAIEDAGGGLFAVNFAYGRRGSTLNTGSKTNVPVSLAEATKIYDKLVLSKTAKGYKPDGTSIASVVNTPTGSALLTSVVTDRDQRDTGLYPQLLVAVSEAEAELYLTDDAWGAQEKFDGKRMQVRKDDAGIVAANRKGLSIGFPDAIADALKAVFSGFTMDGEAIGDNFYAFDLLEYDGTEYRDRRYVDRIAALKDLADGLANVTVVFTAVGTDAKRRLMADLKARGKEGIVFKKMSAPWSAGRPESGGPALKCKFWSSCSCVVLKVNAKRSITVSLEGQDIGKVTIPPNKDIPAAGQVVEVKYLYVVGKGGKLYQPIYIGSRDDVDAGECTFEQQKLKYKAESED